MFRVPPLLCLPSSLKESCGSHSGNIFCPPLGQHLIQELNDKITENLDYRKKAFVLLRISQGNRLATRPTKSSVFTCNYLETIVSEGGTNASNFKSRQRRKEVSSQARNSKAVNEPRNELINENKRIVIKSKSNFFSLVSLSFTTFFKNSCCQI